MSEALSANMAVEIKAQADPMINESTPGMGNLDENPLMMSLNAPFGDDYEDVPRTSDEGGGIGGHSTNPDHILGARISSDTALDTDNLIPLNVSGPQNDGKSQSVQSNESIQNSHPDHLQSPSSHSNPFNRALSIVPSSLATARTGLSNYFCTYNENSFYRSIRGPITFLAPNQFSVPKGLGNALIRLKSNGIYFLSNYILIGMLFAVFELFTSPMAFFGCLALLAFVVIAGKTEKIGEYHLNSKIKWIGIITIMVFGIIFLGIFDAISYALIACLVVAGFHGIFHKPTAIMLENARRATEEGMGLEIDLENPNLEKSTGKALSNGPSASQTNSEHVALNDDYLIASTPFEQMN